MKHLATMTLMLKGAHMKTITRSRIYLPMAAIILTAGLAIPAAAQQQVPFRYLPRKGRRQPLNHHYERHGDWDAYGSILIDPRHFANRL